MKIDVYIDEKSKNTDTDEGLCSAFSYCWLFDPFILGRTKSIPRMMVNSQFKSDNTPDLLISPNQVQEDIASYRDLLVRMEKKGRALLLVQPSRNIYSCLKSLKAVCYREDILSTKENWHIDIPQSRSYSYPDGYSFQRIEHCGREIYSWIGENPGNFIKNRVAVFTIDVFSTYLRYLNQDMFHFSEDLTILYVKSILKVLNNECNDRMLTLMKKTFDLRRDFHAFGFAYLKVSELSSLLRKRVNLDSPQIISPLVKGAELICSNRIEDGQKNLKVAFQRLNKVSWELAPIPKYLIDSLHGGVLFEKAGFGEFDWPQSVSRILYDYIKLVETRNYRFCYEVGAGTLEHFAKKFPKLCSKLSSLWKRGKMEFVNGTYSQPYPQYFSLESNIRQFENGVLEMSKILRKRPESYVAQEFGFTPQLPQVLKQFGYKYCIHRAQNQGDTPVIKEDKILWNGKDGSVIETLPSCVHKSEKLGDRIYKNLPQLIVKALNNNCQYVAITNLIDQTFNGPFKEETIRTAYYAPIFGKFVTCSDFFNQTERAKVTKEFTMDDYEPLFFIPIDNYHSYESGNFIYTFVKIQRIENLILATETLCSIISIFDSVSMPNYISDWKRLLEAEGHDAWLLPWFKTGAFLERYLVDYYGPRYQVTSKGPRGTERFMKDIIGEELAAVEKSLQKELDVFLRRIAEKVAIKELACTHFLYFNPLSQERMVTVELPTKGKSDFKVVASDELLLSQKEDSKLIFNITLPPLGYRVVSLVSEKEASKTLQFESGVRVNGNVMENENLLIEIDKRSGAMSRIYDKTEGREVLSGLGNELIYINGSWMKAKAVQVVERGPIRGKILSQGDIIRNGKIVANFLIETILRKGSSIVSFKIKIELFQPLEGEQWVNSIRTRFTLSLKREKEVLRNYWNVTEKTMKDKYASLYFTRICENGYCIELYNRGNQYYLVEDNQIENLLIYSNEESREFEIAIGINTRGGSEASLSWQLPPLSTKISVGSGILPLRLSFFSLDKDNVSISSLRCVGNALKLLITEKRGKDSLVKIQFFKKFKSAQLNDLLDNKLKDLDIKNDSVSFDIKGWGFRNIWLFY